MDDSMTAQNVQNRIFEFADSPDFMFQLSPSEAESLRSQFATLEYSGRGKHRKYRPYVFTEQGVAMLSGVLLSDRAIDVNIAIMRAFVKLRHAVLAHQGIARRVEKLEGKVICMRRTSDYSIKMLPG